MQSMQSPSQDTFKSTNNPPPFFFHYIERNIWPATKHFKKLFHASCKWYWKAWRKQNADATRHPKVTHLFKVNDFQCNHLLGLVVNTWAGKERGEKSDVSESESRTREQVLTSSTRVTSIACRAVAFITTRTASFHTVTPKEKEKCLAI